MIDVNALFHSRYPAFCDKHPLASKAIIQGIRWLWKEKVFHEFKASHAEERGCDLVKAGFNYINFKIAVSDTDLQKIPKQGPVLLIANHPIGSLDGVGLLKIGMDVRPDVKVVANAMLHAVEEMRDVVIPVDNMGKGASRDAIKGINEQLKQGGAIALFPAGKVSRYYDGKIQDDTWQSGFIKFAQKSNARIVPVHFAAQNSGLFYWLSKNLFSLSTLWLVREVFTFKNKTIQATIGEPLDLNDYKDQSTEQLAALVRQKVYALHNKNDERP